MIRKTVLALLLAATGVSAHAALNAGDIAFTSFNADEDGWSIVALSNISANTVVHFTDNTWNGASFANTEAAQTWNSGANTIQAGTVVRFTKVESTTAIGVSHGSISFASTANLGLSATNETLYAYQGSAWNVTPSSFLAAISSAPSGFGNVSFGVLTNTGLTEGTSAVAITSSTDFGQYTGTRSGQNDFAGYRSLVNTSANWTNNTGGDQLLTIPNTTAFAVTAVPEPKNYAMLLAGLGLMGAIARRRSR